MTYEEIAKKADTSAMSVSNVMRGKKTTNRKLAQIVARIRGGKPSDYLYVVRNHAPKVAKSNR